MPLDNLPVNIVGAIFSLCWFLAGLWAMKSFSENHKLHLPSLARSFMILLSPLLGLIGAAAYVFLTQQKQISDLIKAGKSASQKKAEKMDLTLLDEHGRDVQQKSGNQAGIPTVKKIIWDALNLNASDIFLDPKNDSYLIRFRVDGAIRVHSTLPVQEALPIISMFKVFSNMDIAEKRRPQDGAFNAMYKGSAVAFRAATVGVYGGEKVTLRVIAAENSNRKITEIGFSKSQFGIVNSALKIPSGMILICGPTGSGKTSTLYAMLSSLDYNLKNVLSIEDPVERVIPNISQIEVNSKAGITFASVLRNSLRQNPDVICLGEIRDEETATIAAQAAQTGHLIIATLHSNDNISTIVRLTDLGIPLRNIAAALQLSISQRLIRRLCPHCKKTAQLNEVQQSYCTTYNIPFDAIKQPHGCPKCGNTGYLGRIAVFELLTMNDNMRKVLEQPETTITDVKDYVESTLGTAALGSRIMSYVINGETSWDEYERATINF
ncbi:MAG: type II/IV secretion system protein [Lentisphaeria bacterium]|nr:type II/IV secretion system protein [Lentisphaeria bacterium]